MLHWLEQLQNIQRWLHQHSWEHFKRARCIDRACPLSWVCDHSIFSCTNKTRSFNQYAENMVSTLKHTIVTEKNNESSTEMTINYIHVYAYTILNHIQYRYTTRTPHARHGIPNTGNLSHHITSYLTVCSKTYSFCHQAFTLLTLCEDVGHRKIPSATNLLNRILCAVLERYLCDRIPLQITRWPFCYAVSDRYRAFISANPRWKCSFDIVLISPNRHHMR